jgi:hypothetical protein
MYIKICGTAEQKLSADITKEERSQISILISYLKKLEKKSKINPKQTMPKIKRRNQLKEIKN